ncbi:hypothetical protein WKI68_09495 [Streptomyces sp. MS1.HAVA.3]|uniref:UL36 very large tegument protein n=1 Tax=Streptomyces caledonius TaxID=3134107 RepID=A0ABU8U178_9ACTN
MPPWDVVESLLRDLAGARGAEFAARETVYAARLRAAAVAAWDRLPGGEDELRTLLTAAAAQRAESEEALRSLTARLGGAVGAAETDALTRELSWTQDDVARAAARHEDLAARLQALRAAPTEPWPAPPKPEDALPGVPRQRPAPAPARPMPPPAAPKRCSPGRRPLRGGPTHRSPGPRRPSTARRPPPGGSTRRTSAPRLPPGNPRRLSVSPRRCSGGQRLLGVGQMRRSPGPRLPSAAPRLPSGGPQGGGCGVGGGPVVLGTAGAASPEGAAFTPPPGHPADDGAPGTGQPAPRGARFGRAQDPDSRGARTEPGPATEPAPGPEGVSHGAASAGTTRALAAELLALRAQGRTGEAHALLCEAAAWTADRLPGLAAELARAGLAADWATLLWEAASLPPEQLAAAAAALGDAGREADCDALLRQGVARPAAEVADAALALGGSGRIREADALLGAFVRVRTAEEAAGLARHDPQWFAPRLLQAARALPGTRHRDLVHALRVAGIGAA